MPQISLPLFRNGHLQYPIFASEGVPSEDEDEDDRQVAGHAGTLIFCDDGTLLKKVGDEEVAFYSSLEKHSSLSPFLPQFHGIEYIEGETWVHLQDLTAGMLKPSILDIKMGSKTYNRSTAAEKVERCKQKDQASTTASLGLRLSGMKKFDRQEEEYLKMGRDECKSLDEEGLVEALKGFFHDGVSLRQELVLDVLKRVQEIKFWFSQNEKLRFTASSLLLVYDSSLCSGEARAVCSMIDMAHVEEIVESDGESRDEGYLLGLGHLQEYLEGLL